VSATIEQDVPHPEDGRAGLAVSTPYSADWVDEIKELPADDRRWDAERKVWWVYCEHLDVVTALCVRHFGTVLVCGSGGESDRWVDANGEVEQGGLF
jgi:hypothetical protein